MSKNKAGFTLIEMVVIVPMAIFVVLAMITAVVTLTNHASQTNLLTRRSNDIRSALDTIEQDISLSNAFLMKNGFNLDPSQKFNSQDFALARPSSDAHQLILQSLLTTDNPLSDDTSKRLVHEKHGGSTETCRINPPLYSNIVYFIDGGTLYRRTLFPTNYQDMACETPWQQPTCKKVIGGFCKTEDMKLLEDAELDLSFMTANEPDVALTSVFDTSLPVEDRQTTLSKAEIVRIKLRTSVSEVKGDKPTVLELTLRANRIP